MRVDRPLPRPPEVEVKLHDAWEHVFLKLATGGTLGGAASAWAENGPTPLAFTGWIS